MSLETWKSLFDGLAIFAAAVTLVSLLGGYFTGNAIARRDAEQRRRSELTIATLQENARGRTIDADARAILLDGLGAAAPAGPIDISFVTESETRAFMLEIVGLLKEAGWVVGRPDGGPAAGGMVTGLSVLVAPGEEVPERAMVLHQALERAGFPTKIRQAGKVKSGGVTLQVGTKP